jgi:hypothetical protein
MSLEFVDLGNGHRFIDIWIIYERRMMFQSNLEFIIFAYLSKHDEPIVKGILLYFYHRITSVFELVCKYLVKQFGELFLNVDKRHRTMRSMS